MRKTRISALAMAIACCLGGCGDEKMAGRAYRDAADRMLAARSFLAEIGAQQGIESTQSGLLYRVEKRGDPAGLRPSVSSTVRAHYRARFADGNEIESSYERNSPAEFEVNRLIAGWREGVMLMRPGDRFTFYIPPQLAYGARGKPPLIAPNAVLVYEVALIDVITE